MRAGWLGGIISYSAASELREEPLVEREHVDEDVNPDVLGLITGDTEDMGTGISTAKQEREQGYPRSPYILPASLSESPNGRERVRACQTALQARNGGVSQWARERYYATASRSASGVQVVRSLSC